MQKHTGEDGSQTNNKILNTAKITFVTMSCQLPSGCYHLTTRTACTTHTHTPQQQTEMHSHVYTNQYSTIIAAH